LIPDDYTRIGLKLPGQLPFPHVECINTGSSILEQAVCESTGGGAEIRARSSGGRDLELIKRCLQFGARPARKRQLAKNANIGLGIDLLARFVDLLLTNQYLARQEQSLRFVPALGQAAFYKQ
jgi:hypothetical protein